MSAKRGPGGYLPEDLTLWDEVKKTVKPLRKRRPLRKESEETGREAAVSPSSKLPENTKQPSARITAPAAPKPPPLAKFDRRTRSRVARGHIEIDGRLDLHGLTLERARTRLSAFLAQSQSRGDGLVLVITGKGTSGRGALRHEVPQWLALADFRALVIGFEEAAPHHGGAGALYVRIRRYRE